MSLEQILICVVFVSFTLGYLARDTTLRLSRKDLTKRHDRRGSNDVGPPSFS